MGNPSPEALSVARQKVEDEHLGKGNVHSVFEGEITKDGKPTGEIGVVVSVDKKLPSAQIANPVPQYVPACGESVRVKVVEAPRPSPELLFLSDAAIVAFAMSAMAPQNNIEDWQRCHQCPMPGGVQIAPNQAGWVGTLSCAVKGKDRNGRKIVGALTNYHVAVSQEQAGILMGQPSGASGDWFAKLDRWAPIQFSTNANNRVDGAFLNTWRDDKQYAPGCHTVKPEQLNLGRINPNPVLTHQIGDLVHKSGRTTGYQKGRVTGINGTSHIAYSQGTARFVGQTIITGESGLFSGPGDSGSLVLTQADNRPYGLLFAGGGGTTIINPIRDVIEAFDLEFFA